MPAGRQPTLLRDLLAKLAGRAAGGCCSPIVCSWCVSVEGTKDRTYRLSVFHGREPSAYRRTMQSQAQYLCCETVFCLFNSRSLPHACELCDNYTRLSTNVLLCVLYQDWCLWETGEAQRNGDLQHHRTRTIYY